LPKNLKKTEGILSKNL